MGGSFSTFHGYVGTIEIRSGKDRRLRRLRANDGTVRFRKGFLSGDHGSALQERVVACYRHDHRFAGTHLSLQRPWDKSEPELDPANAAFGRATPCQPKRATAHALSP